MRVIATLLEAAAARLEVLANAFRNQDRDVQEALEFMLEWGETYEPGADPSTVFEWTTEQRLQVPLEELDELTHAPDREWDHGELQGLTDEELQAELAGFRGDAWAKTALTWLAGSIPAVVLAHEGHDDPGVLADGYGRFNLAWGLGLKSLPVIDLFIQRQGATAAGQEPTGLAPGQTVEAWLQDLEKLPTRQAKLKAARATLMKLGQGGSRAVFALDDKRVLKVALHDRGVAQCQTEADISNVGYECVADVQEHDPEYHWLAVERAVRRASGADWKRLAGVTWKTAQAYISSEGERRAGRDGRKDIDPELHDHELLGNVSRLIADFDMLYGDLTRPSAWGVVVRDGKEQLVLVDFGVTQEVYREHYPNHFQNWKWAR